MCENMLLWCLINIHMENYFLYMKISDKNIYKILTSKYHIYIFKFYT